MQDVKHKTFVMLVEVGLTCSLNPIQVVGVPNLGDFTHLYEFADGYADFVPWNVVGESKGGSQTPQTETVTVAETEISTELETEEISTEEISQKQKQDGGIKLEELEFANLHIDEGLEDATTTAEWVYPQGNMSYPETDQDTDILQSDMLELLDMYEAVQGQITSQEKMAILRKCIHVCQQIIERGNPIRAPLPQVVTILGEAKSMLQMIEKEDMAGIEVRTKEFEGVAESVHMSQVSMKSLLQTEVKEALERADKEEEEQATNGVSEVHNLCIVFFLISLSCCEGRGRLGFRLFDYEEEDGGKHGEGFRVLQMSVVKLTTYWLKQSQSICNVSSRL